MVKLLRLLFVKINCQCHIQRFQPLIDTIETSIDKIVKTNIEREEKEKLFKLKVQELKNIFETKNLENLKGLKFDVEELTNLLQNEPEEDNAGITEGAKSA